MTTNKLLADFRMVYAAWELSQADNHPELYERVKQESRIWTYVPSDSNYSFTPDGAPKLPAIGPGMYPLYYLADYETLCAECASLAPYDVEDYELGDVDHEVLCSGCGTVIVKEWNSDAE